MANGKMLQTAVVLAWVLGWTLPAGGQEFSGGTGEPNNPYLIATAQDLIDLGQSPEVYDKHFRLTADIDLAGYVFDQAVIAPDTDSSDGVREGECFGGVLDGRGHVIRDLRIEGMYTLGLFGVLDVGAVVHDLGLEGVSIHGTSWYAGGLAGVNLGIAINCHASGAVTGTWSVGGLVGSNGGGMYNCHAAGTVTGQKQNIGGLIGFNNGSIAGCYSTSETRGDHYVGGLIGGNDDGNISGCYSRGIVSGVALVGGLVGWNRCGSVSDSHSSAVASGDDTVGGLVGRTYTAGTRSGVTNCYSTGTVTGDTNVGGLVGESSAGAVKSCFWDVESSGVTTSPAGRGLRTAAMMKASTYVTADWDFAGERANGVAEIWQMPQTGGYPQLTLFEGFERPWPSGRGTATEPYRITNAEEFVSIGYRPWACYRLEADISFSGITWAVAPVPWFGGQFEGNGHVIHDLDIRGGSCLGLFGALEAAAVVANLRLEYASVQGTADLIGLLAGRNNGAVQNCYGSGVVDGAGWYIGGLIGRNWYLGRVSECRSQVTVAGGRGAAGGLVGANLGSVSRCCSGGTVSGSSSIGGLVGDDAYGEVSDCYSTGSVIGDIHIGGLIGRACVDSVSRSYSCATVTGNASIGGLLGTASIARTTNSFWDMESSGVTHSSGGAGLTTAEMMDPEWIGLQGWANNPNWVLAPHKDYPRLAWEQSPGQAIPESTTDWIDGEGTEEAPFQIVEPSQLVLISKASGLWQKHFVLMADLDLAALTWPQAVLPGFGGTFDGNGHVLRNLVVSGNAYAGLVGWLDESGTLIDLTLLDAQVTGCGQYVGALAGFVYGGRVTHCRSAGLIRGGERAGGLVGKNYGGDMSICHSACDVTGDQFVGGVVGVQSDKAALFASYSTGTITGNEYVGGLVGSIANRATVSNCYTQATVTGDRSVGGLAGRVSSECTVARCYSSAPVTADFRFGGLIDGDDDNVVDCFWDMTTSGLTRSDGGTGLVTEAMWDIDTYLGAGWDFVGESINGTDDIWWIDDGQDYPHLWWEAEEF